MPLTEPSLFVDNDFSFQGQIYVAERTPVTGVPGPLWWVANCPKAEFAQKIERRIKRESFSGLREIKKTRIKTRDGELTMTWEDINVRNIIVGMLGKEVTTAGGSITGETFPTVAVKDIVKLKYPNASSIVLTDSAGTPATLTANTHYKVLDAKAGLIEILSLGSFTQPFKAAYTAGAVKVVTGMEGDDSKEYYIYCSLLNTEPSTDQAVGLEIYRAAFDPATLLALINEDQGSFDVKATVMRDSVRATSTETGGYYRWIYNDANL
jgi:hypothetical protein